MNRHTWLIAAVACLAPVAMAAQTTPLPAGQSSKEAISKVQNVMTGSATIEAIDATARMITLKFDSGMTDTLTVGPDAKRFGELKVGDKVNMKYYESVVYQIRPPGGTPATGEIKTAATAGRGATPGGTVAAQTVVTVSVTAIDPKVPSITVKTPKGHIVPRRINDPTHLPSVKVGDQIDITYTAAVLIDVQPMR
jgi:Cu/Ag efflux protein CusF